MSFLGKILSFGSDKKKNFYKKQVESINKLEPTISELTDEELLGKTEEFRNRLRNNETLNDILVEAFACVREASKRSLGKRHYDVQLIGGMVLNDGCIAEMRTGEGKTLVSTLAGYLNALESNVHIITVNEYLAERDAAQMSRVYERLGISVGLIKNGMDNSVKKQSYLCDITYGTNSEFGFDYLRDNMVMNISDKMQRGHNFCIIDEVDSILIDEARTPLIISGNEPNQDDRYEKFAEAVLGLREYIDYNKDESKNVISLTDTGLIKVEEKLGIEDIYADTSGDTARCLNNAVRAEYFLKRDVDYAVIDNEVKIVDEFTGRIMEGRRWSDGLHQAVEAKEKVPIKNESITLATITLQNYFRLYKKLSGMTGTAMTEESEFNKTYKLGVVVVPTNKPPKRIDNEDIIYKDLNTKFDAIVGEVKRRHEIGQPVLIGTTSIEKSEKLSELLHKNNIPHEVLNAKYHAKEAAIISQAGRRGAVTIATNMAGRGTDILLGGNPEQMAIDSIVNEGFSLDNIDEVLLKEKINYFEEECRQEGETVRSLGGLYVIGTDRHESRRIDNQLKGRAGRQGDPGETQFYLSLNDDVMKLFGDSRMDAIKEMMTNNGEDSLSIGLKQVTKAVNSAQRTVEALHQASRKNTLEYDDVIDLQRKAIYKQRDFLLNSDGLNEKASDIIREIAEEELYDFYDEEECCWDFAKINEWVYEISGGHLIHIEEINKLSDEDIQEKVIELLIIYFNKVRDSFNEVEFNYLIKVAMLKTLDSNWRNHLSDLDYLKTGISLRSLGHRDPLVEYKNEAYDSFANMVKESNKDFLKIAFRLKPAIAKVEVKVKTTPILTLN